MWDILGILIVCSMVGVTVGGYLKHNLRKSKELQEYDRESGEDIQRLNEMQVTTEEYERVLSFMFYTGIIDFDTWQNLKIKGYGMTVQRKIKY